MISVVWYDLCMNNEMNNLSITSTHVKIKTAANPNKWYKIQRMVLSFDANPRPRIVYLWGGAAIPARLVTDAKEEN